MSDGEESERKRRKKEKKAKKEKKKEKEKALTMSNLSRRSDASGAIEEVAEEDNPYSSYERKSSPPLYDESHDEYGGNGSSSINIGTGDMRHERNGGLEISTGIDEPASESHFNDNIPLGDGDAGDNRSPHPSDELDLDYHPPPPKTQQQVALAGVALIVSRGGVFLLVIVTNY